MGYLIQYGLSGEKRRISASRKWIQNGLKVLAVIGVAFIAVWSLRADWGVIVTALESMAGQLQEGGGVQEAFSSFCLEILEGAQIG